MKQRLKKALIWFPILFISSIVGLEMYTGNCHCAATKHGRADRVIPICEESSDTRFHYSLEQTQRIAEIKEQRSAGESITKETYREALDLLVYEVPPEQLGPANGVVCRGGIAFVDESLPTQARLFVARHELEHLFQTTSENREVNANIAAGKEYPVGLISTIYTSLVKSKQGRSWCCFLKSSWWIFKVYFLGIDDADW